MIYTFLLEVVFMLTAKIFESGRSQAVRIPKEFRFDEDLKEVYINRVGDVIMLTPINSKWSTFIDQLNQENAEFDVNIPEDLQVQDRESL